MKQPFLLLVFLASIPVWASIGDCRNLRHHGKLIEAQTCFGRFLRDADPFIRAQAYWGIDRYFEANDEFREAAKAQHRSAEIRVEWGRLYLDHYQPGDAAKLFEEAIEIDTNYAPAYLGLAQVASQGFDKKALEFAQEALKRDPKLTEAHELMAYLALEDKNTKLATEEAQRALDLSGEALDAMALLASIDWLNDKPQSEWMERIRAVNPVYGEAYATGAHFFEINYRYKEAIDYDRKALDLNPNLWAARSQLGINLMRLGLESEAKEQLERCFDAHHSNPQTRNALRFLDTLSDYQTFKTAHGEIVLNKKEAALLRPYMEDVLERASATYQRKYKMTLPGPVRVEVYPNHDDFVVRTLGLPGQGGLLGVTFGTVVAMDSPSARPPGAFNWGSTLWHEMSHVYVLTATNHLVPRWFTEGLAVHEEGAASSDWGDRLTPEIVAAVKEKKLLPVLELDRGFVRPDYPDQVIVSYFEAGKICDYISEKWGNDALLGMIHAYATRKSTADAIADNLHESAAAFDKDFSSWLNARMHSEERAEERKRSVESAYAEKGPKGVDVGELEAYRDSGGENTAILKELARYVEQAGNSDQAEITLKKLIYIYPFDEDIHRQLGRMLLHRGDAAGAVREFQALLALKPQDLAEAHYELARAFNAAHRMNEAKDEVILSLEAAPGFKSAQQLLLELSQP